MRKMSNRARKRMIDKALFCKKQGDLKRAIEILDRAIKIESIGLEHELKKLHSKSWATVPTRPQVTLSNQAYYNKGDYYYNELDLVYIRKTRATA